MKPIDWNRVKYTSLAAEQRTDATRMLYQSIQALAGGDFLSSALAGQAAANHFEAAAKFDELANVRYRSTE